MKRNRTPWTYWFQSGDGRRWYESGRLWAFVLTVVVGFAVIAFGIVPALHLMYD